MEDLKVLNSNEVTKVAETVAKGNEIFDELMEERALGEYPDSFEEIKKKAHAYWEGYLIISDNMIRYMLKEGIIEVIYGAFDAFILHVSDHLGVLGYDAFHVLLRVGFDSFIVINQGSCCFDLVKNSFLARTKERTSAPSLSDRRKIEIMMPIRDYSIYHEVGEYAPLENIIGTYTSDYTISEQLYHCGTGWDYHECLLSDLPEDEGCLFKVCSTPPNKIQTIDDLKKLLQYFRESRAVISWLREQSKD